MRNITNLDREFQIDALSFIDRYSQKLGGIRPDFTIKKRPDGPYLIIEFAKPNERHYRIHNEVVEIIEDSNFFKERSTVQKRRSPPTQRLTLPETQILKKEIAQNLTVDRYSFGQDFFLRYTPSVTGFEQQIIANSNFVVYGRRGAGKSSLLAYALHCSIRESKPFIWIPLQTYSNRADYKAIPAILFDILYEFERQSLSSKETVQLKNMLEVIIDGTKEDKSVLDKCDQIIPRIRRILGSSATPDKTMTIFLDDIHLLADSVQPILLGFVYKVSRGNNIYIKASGIGQLTRLYDTSSNTGLQAPHDAQILTLDNNLTMPGKSKEHIVSILDAHAQYCGLPNIGYLANDAVFSRLVLVAAGVPRDSMNLFSLAISKATARDQKNVSVTSVNAAASEMAEEKLKDIERDSGEDQQDLRSILEEIKEFCISSNRKNAFLVEIKYQEPRYHLIQKLAALRLVHLLHEGITPHKAGKRFIALMLDYGFYVGIRAARSVQLIPPEPRALLAKELRSLPIFE